MTTKGDDVEEKLIYRPVFEAFLDGVEERSTPAFRAELSQLGLQVDKLLPGYPYDVWEKSVLAAARLFPELEEADAVAEVGKRMAAATVKASPVGKTLLPLLRMMGTARGLKRAYGRSTSENYNVVTFGAETPKSLEMHMSYVGNIPDMTRGSVYAMGDAMGVVLRAKVASFTFPSATYLIEWD